MTKISIEVRNGAARRQAVSIAGRLYPGGDVRVRFPIDPEGFFVKDIAAPARRAA